MISIPLWRAVIVLLICLGGVLFSLPTFLSEATLKTMPSWFPTHRVNLGLDLQGGSHLLLEVDVKSGLKDRLQLTLEDIRTQLRKEKIFYSALMLQGEAITFRTKESADVSNAEKILKRFDSHFIIDIKDNNQLSVTFDEMSREDYTNKIIAQSLEIVSRRIDQLGTKEPSIQRQGHDRIILQLPGLQDPSHIKNLLGQTAKMTFRLVHPETPFVTSEDQIAPQGYEALPFDENQKPRGLPPRVYVEKRIALGGEHLVDAQVSFGEHNEAKVAFRFDTAGGRKFAEITRNNVNRMLAIVLDNKVVSAPNINGVIAGGSGEITGNFTSQEATDLAILMRAGALPAPLKIIEERTVGPDLGADSINAGENATIISMMLVAVFMIIAYALFGVFSVIALLFNLALLVAVLALTGSTLTLPGIAGIALTIGMAVDANVLIYERIKEELRNGKKIVIAVEAGYKRAIATILDSNITTLIGAAALYFWGSGPIKGFGVTLTFGIIISMFTAITLSKILAMVWIKWRKPKVLSI